MAPQDLQSIDDGAPGGLEGAYLAATGAEPDHVAGQ